MCNVFGYIIYCKYAGEDLGKTWEKKKYEKQQFYLTLYGLFSWMI